MGEINSGDNVKARVSIPLEYFCSGNDAQQSSASTARGRHTEAPVGTPEPDTNTFVALASIPCSGNGFHKDCLGVRDKGKAKPSLACLQPYIRPVVFQRLKRRAGSQSGRRLHTCLLPPLESCAHPEGLPIMF